MGYIILPKGSVVYHGTPNANVKKILKEQGIKTRLGEIYTSPDLFTSEKYGEVLRITLLEDKEVLQIVDAAGDECYVFKQNLTKNDIHVELLTNWLVDQLYEKYEIKTDYYPDEFYFIIIHEGVEYMITEFSELKRAVEDIRDCDDLQLI